MIELNRWICRASLALLGGVGVVGCSSSSDSGNDTYVPDGPPATGPITSMKSGWNEIDPGGSTVCAHGAPYRFWVRPGKVNRVVIDFRGGGACWNTLTCGIGDTLFQPTADPEPWMDGSEKPVGIYDHSRADNPFRDWHHVYVSYCTGDVHWGDKETTYGQGTALETTIQHRGAVNAKAALDWVYQNVPDPDKVFVTGCSAGGYGAALWSAYVRQHYTNATVYQLADSAAGVITDTFFQESFPSWNATANFPSFIGIDPTSFTRLSQLYIAIGTTFPQMPIGEYNTVYDETQSSYYNAMGGGDATEWSQKMQASVGEINAGTPSFKSYLAPDFQHCIINSANFYSVRVGGIKLRDWVANIVKDQQVDDVSCEDDASCGAPKPAG